LCHIQNAGYETKKATVRGGWDKCLGPFDHYQAKAFGIDVWDCHSNNCYIRKDYNGGMPAADYCTVALSYDKQVTTSAPEFQLINDLQCFRTILVHHKPMINSLITVQHLDLVYARQSNS